MPPRAAVRLPPLAGPPVRPRRRQRTRAPDPCRRAPAQRRASTPRCSPLPWSACPLRGSSPVTCRRAAAISARLRLAEHPQDSRADRRGLAPRRRRPVGFPGQDRERAGNARDRRYLHAERAAQSHRVDRTPGPAIQHELEPGRDEHVGEAGPGAPPAPSRQCPPPGRRNRPVAPCPSSSWISRSAIRAAPRAIPR